MKTKWTRSAQAELRDIIRHVRRERPEAARRLADRLRTLVREAAEFPALGRMVPELGDESIRERVLRPYRVVYRVEVDRILVLGIVHGRRRLPPEVDQRS